MPQVAPLGLHARQEQLPDAACGTSTAAWVSRESQRLAWMRVHASSNYRPRARFSNPIGGCRRGSFGYCRIWLNCRSPCCGTSNKLG